MEGQPPRSVINSDPQTPVVVHSSPQFRLRHLYGLCLPRKLKTAGGPRLTWPTDRELDGAVGESTVMIDVIPEPDPGTGSWSRDRVPEPDCVLACEPDCQPVCEPNCVHLTDWKLDCDVKVSAVVIDLILEPDTDPGARTRPRERNRMPEPDRVAIGFVSAKRGTGSTLHLV